MASSSASRPRRYVARSAAAVVAVALLVGGCASEEKAAPPAPRPTPIADLNTTGMQVPRIDFCRLVPGSAVRDAIGGKASSDTAYGNGDTEPASGAGNQVLHEIGCTWSAADGTTARAWVFARPVDAAFARTVTKQAPRSGCRVVPGPAFGRPTSTQQCSLPGGVARVRHAGLFGQTWLTCEVAGAAGTPVTAVTPRADAWCVEVAESLNTAR